MRYDPETARSYAGDMKKAEIDASLRALLPRIQRQYLERPDLCLTSSDARRYWGLDADSCEEVLRFLVERGFLDRTSRGSYVLGLNAATLE